MSKKYQNVEIKAVAQNFVKQQKIAEALSGKPPQILKQEDFYFNIPKGRLKLRVLSIKKGQLIYYERPDEPGPKVSDYQIYETNTPNKLIEVLEMSYGIRNIVKKTRKLYIYKRTRIHMDSVDDLGDFIELEVIMGSNDNHLSGKDEARSLIDRLEITEEDLIHCSYIDLLESK